MDQLSADNAATSPTNELALEPPVTKGALSKLDVNMIANNPNLRHEINFEPDLQLRPRDSEKGRRKTQGANDFWETMRVQLEKYITNRGQFEEELGKCGVVLAGYAKGNSRDFGDSGSPTRPGIS